MTTLDRGVRRPAPPPDPAGRAAPASVVDLRIGGMTCASCASRVEKKLNRLDGVVATVNFATETARVEHDPTIAVTDLISTVEATGYQAVAMNAAAMNKEAAVRADDGSALARLVVATSLTLPLLLVAMVPGWQFAGWQWWVFALATPVVTWCAWPFHRAALTNLRHGAATMDTLISLGAIVSYSWSVIALFTGGHLYFEVGAALVTFLLIGRYVEVRAKRRAGSVLRALLELGAKDAAVLRAGVEHRVPVAQLRVDDLFVVRPGERLATDGVVTEGASAVDASMMTGESLPVEVAPGAAVVGGTVNVGGRLIVRATRVGAAHAARTDGPARRGGPVRQGAGAAARRPRRECLRAGRAGRGRRYVCRLAARRRLGRRGADQRGRRPHRRLPVRAGPRDADGAARRHRAWSGARHRHPRAPDSRSDAPRRHDRARQDGHRYHRRHARQRRDRGRRPRRCVRRAADRGGGRGGGRASDRSGGRRGGGRDRRTAASRDRLHGTAWPRRPWRGRRAPGHRRPAATAA